MIQTGIQLIQATVLIKYAIWMTVRLFIDTNENELFDPRLKKSYLPKAVRLGSLCQLPSWDFWRIAANSPRLQSYWKYPIRYRYSQRFLTPPCFQTQELLVHPPSPTVPGDRNIPLYFKTGNYWWIVFFLGKEDGGILKGRDDCDWFC